MIPRQKRYTFGMLTSPRVAVGGELVGVDKQKLWLFGEALGSDDGAAFD